VLLIIPGIIPVVASAADGQIGDYGNSANSTLNSNLILEELSTDPKYPKPYGSVTISALVKNVGNEASDPTSIIYTIDGAVDREDVNPIEPGSKSPIYHIWITPEREGPIIVTASLEDVKDSRKEISVIVVENPLPDLIIENIVPEPSEPQEGKPLNFTVRVKNQGMVPSGEILAKYYINGIFGRDINIPPLSEGADTNVAFSLVPDEVKEGPMEVKVFVDSGMTVNEGNESNNEFPKTINVRALLPDLTIESLSLNPEFPKIGENITFTVVIKNNGPEASSSSALKYNIVGTNETYSGKVSVPSLTAGETTQCTFSWTPGNEGNMEINTLIDADAVVPESNEANNQFIKTAAVSKESASTGGEGGGGSSSNSDSGSSSGSSSSSSSGGMGSSFSKEPARNVAARELVTRNVVNGNHIRYDFSEESTCITYIEYDAKRTLLRTTTTVEDLKNKSTFVSKNAPGRIYKHVNVWIGDKRGGLPASLENGLVGFRVEKEWIKNNKLNESLVTLQWYSNNSWEPLYTEKIGEDNTHVYFKSETPGYSFFAITVYREEVNKNEAQVGAKLQDNLKNLKVAGKVDINGSAKNTKVKDARWVAKTLMAISLPLFLIFVGYLLVYKKI
jgi:PGF-pre-PGF domain-containing protein